MDVKVKGFYPCSELERIGYLTEASSVLWSEQLTLDQQRVKLSLI